MILRIVLSIACAAALAVASASAQQKNIRVRGTIEQVDGPVLTIKSRDGDTLKVKMAYDAKVVALVKASLADIKPGSFVGSTAMPEEDGRWKAVEVHIFPEEMRGTGEGDRPYDYKPKSTMTNGTVNALAKRKVNGAVETAEGATLTLNYKDGEKQIDVTPATVIVIYAPAARTNSNLGPRSIFQPRSGRRMERW